MPDYNGELNGTPVSQRRNLAPLGDQQVSDIMSWLLSHRLDFPGAPYPSLEQPRGSNTQTP